MNRKTFLQLSVALTGVSSLAVQGKPFLPIPKALLLGKGEPKLMGSPNPLLEEVYHAFVRMQHKAALEGITIEIVSAYRSYNRQQAIWNRKFTANKNAGYTPIENIQKIIEYSTLPGTSRHHWGTDLDIIDGSVPKEGDVLLTEKFYDNGPYAQLREWLESNAADFGFIAPYTKDSNRKGFYYEPWHYSYAPLAKKYLNDYLKLDLQTSLKAPNLLGKEALNSAFLTRYIDENILGINPLLR